MYRSIYEQLEDKDVRRLKIVQMGLETCRVPGRVSSYYIFEICRAIESGLLLASFELSTTLLELWLRDLLVVRKLTTLSISDKREIPYHLAQLDMEIEGIKRGMSYRDMVLELQELEVIEQSEREWLMHIFNNVRNPLHHGLSGKLIGRRAPSILKYKENITTQDKILASIFGGFDSPHRRLDNFEKLLDDEAISILEGVLNFLAAHPIPTVGSYT
ncbi:hypothetical protein [Vibrio coralliilyticus]|uniref:hypothetical protein n=1 Tax=Vibrio coralliilyticus TaxID=190893 RepID=UPI0015607D19|nr:hypothetical protein [Vibrio coralliilyticus]NRF16514.1 hypothetical protein [Vibrio coralliilyticus]